MRNFCKIFSCLALVIIMLLTMTILASCGGGDLTPEYGFSILEELDDEEISRRYKLLNKYEKYKYLELRVEYFDGTTDPIKTENIFIHNIFDVESGTMDLLIYIESASINGMSYDLIKKDRPEGYSFYHSERASNEDEIVKSCPIVITETEYKKILNSIFNKYYDPSILPVQESDIQSVSKKSISLSSSTIMTMELIFNGKYENEAAVNSVRFNYNTNKIHSVSNYSADGTTLLRCVEYVYPGNAVTDPTEINNDLFSKYHANILTKEENRVEASCHTAGSYDYITYCEACGLVISTESKTIDCIAHTPGESIVENKIDATCTLPGSYDEVVYCSAEGCKVEISRTPREEAINPDKHVDENTDGVCDLCHHSAELKIGD